MNWTRKTIAVAGGIAAAYLSWQLTTAAQPTAAGGPRPPNVTRSRFEFEVVESFDGKYLGDTPGHLGRNGGLEGIRPNVALGDPVYHEEQKVGTITSIIWSRAKGSLDVEFDPEPLHRISIGEIVWIAIDGSAASKKTRRP